MAIVNDVNIQHDLHAGITTKAQMRGEYRRMAKSELVLGSDHDRSQYMFNYAGLKQPEHYEIHDIRDSIVISAEVKGDAEKGYDLKTGNKIFLPTTRMSNWYEKITADSTYTSNLILNFPFRKTEALTYTLPDSAHTSLPSNYKLDNALVSFDRKCTRDASGKVCINTELLLKKNIIEPKEIALLKESLQSVNKYLQQKLVADIKQ
jgi:hypothetical protein